MGETKPASIRLDTDTADKFKQFAEQHGFTQNQALDNLLRIFELNNAKMLLPDRQKEIDEFEAHVKRLLEIYINALELNRNTEDYIRQEFLQRLQSRETIIAELQEKLAIETASVKRLTDARLQDAEVIQSHAQQIQNFKKQNDTIGQLVAEYRDKNDTLNSMLTEFKQYKEQAEGLKIQLDGIKTAKTELELLVQKITVDIEKTQQELADLKVKHQQEITMLQDKADVEHQKEILLLKQEFQDKFNQMQQEYNDKVKNLLVELQNSSSKKEIKTSNTQPSKSS